MRLAAINSHGRHPQILQNQHRRILDQNGALTDVPNSSSIKSSPPGNLSAVGNATLSSDVAQGNIGATQSGPGASGLFTPASPGNNAALNAQMNGGLEGSPIVNGTGTNLRVTVPFATPSQNPSYQQYTNDGITGVLPVNPGLNSKALQSAQREVSQNKQSTLTKFTDLQTRPVSIREINNQRITPSYSKHKVQTRNQPPNNLGKVDGFIQYADGKSVMFGSNGALQIDKENNGVLKLNDGRTTKVSKIKSKSYLSKRKAI